MPKPKERAASYVRESDEKLFDSNTIESQAKAVREYIEKTGYAFTPDHEYREAISAYMVPFTKREKLLTLLAAAKRHEFDVVVVSEVRAISRRQEEVAVLYDMLHKYNVRLETISEYFEDSATGKFMLNLRAFAAEFEREMLYLRTMRGKQDRLEIGNAPNGHPKAAYGYVFVDTEREQKARYAFNLTVMYVDEGGREWSEYAVCLFIFESIDQGASLRSVAQTLNEIGIPAPLKDFRKKKTPQWHPSSLYRIVTNRIYIAEVWCNKFTSTGKKYRKRPQEEQFLLPEGTAPALIAVEMFERIQEQLQINKEDSIRNNTASSKDELGLLRGKYCRCGICGYSMYVTRLPSSPTIKRSPQYCCRRKTGSDGLVNNHTTSIIVLLLDDYAWKKVLEVLSKPTWVREHVAQMRLANQQSQVNRKEVEVHIEKLQQDMQKFYALAEQASDPEMTQKLISMMKDLEQRKRKAETMLYDVEENEEEHAAVEAEIVEFETWFTEKQALFASPDYIPSYAEKRRCIRMLGVYAVVFPAEGDYPFRMEVYITLPKIAEKMKGIKQPHELLNKLLKRAPEYPDSVSSVHTVKMSIYS